MDIKLRQVNVNPPGTQINYLGGVGLVDRCQSCHVATDPLVVPVVMTLTKADLGLAKSKDAPSPATPIPICSSSTRSRNLAVRHATAATAARSIPWKRPTAATSIGSGRSTIRKTTTPAASSATPRTWSPSTRPCSIAAKELYREKGCIGCHKFQGFDNQDELLVADAPADSAARKRHARPTSSRFRA